MTRISRRDCDKIRNKLIALQKAYGQQVLHGRRRGKQRAATSVGGRQTSKQDYKSTDGIIAAVAAGRSTLDAIMQKHEEQAALRTALLGQNS
eukprot:SAG31_NODE_442_length_15661_cov_4.132245_16_plen_92_part_00